MAQVLANAERTDAAMASPVALLPRRRPLRPCMVSFYFHPNYSGSAIQALNLSTHLQRLGMRPMIVSANLSGSRSEESFDGIPVHRLSVAKHPDAQIPSFWLSAARFLWPRRNEFDLIHAHGTVQHGVVSLLGRLLKKPTILKVAMADSDLAFARQGRVFGNLNQFMVRRFDRYIATTQAIVEEFNAHGLDRDRIRFIPNGVDTAVFAPVSGMAKCALKERLGFPKRPLVSCVAAVNERKNIDGVLRIWRQAVARGAHGHLAVVGPRPDSRYYEALTQYAREQQITDRVSFVGQQAEVASYLQASDVLLFPSKREGMPNAVIEAMSAGLTCLVSTSSGVEGLIRNGVDGYLLDVSDENGFTEALLTILGDETLRASIGRNAREHISNDLSLGSIAMRYQGLYDELLQCGTGDDKR
jgi:glycosyltransferase involved in cell wall biosynthesis